MSVFVMSDIHGNLFALSNMLKKIEFSKDDQLIILGDIIDRGRYSLELLRFAHESKNVTMLMGNHEYMMKNYYNSKSISDRDVWFVNGGDKTYNQIEKSTLLSSKEKNELIEWVCDLPFRLVLDCNDKKFVLCHANPLAPTEHKMVWDRNFPEDISLKFKKNTIYIVGHTPVNAYYGTEKAKAKWYYDNQVLNIDCGCAFIGDPTSRLCCVRLDDMKEFYVELKD